MGLAPVKRKSELLDLYYHDIRSHLLEAAAAFDRIERASGADDPRIERLRAAGRIALDKEAERARRFLAFLSV